MYKIKEIVEQGIVIFDFDYPIFREEYKKEFEQNFIDNFYTDVIGLETVELFKQRLKVKLKLIMPYYNKIFMSQELEQRILDNYDVTEVYSRTVSADATNTTNSVNKNLYKDAPKTRIDINNFDVVTNLSKDEGNTTSNAASNNTENWERKMTGNIGVQTDADAIVKYWTSLRKVEQEIFDELEVLFLGVYI